MADDSNSGDSNTGDAKAEDRAAIRHKLEALRVEHRDLDDVIARVNEEAPFDQLRMQRLKKRKLALRDHINRLESELVPDIIA